MMAIRLALLVVLGSAVPGCGARAVAQQPLPAQPDARWIVEVKAGRFEPDVADYARFYGDDRARYLALAFAYRFNPWLEAGAELQYMREKGAGMLESTGAPGGSVRYTLAPVHVFVILRGEFHPDPLFVPYVGLGLARAFYRQKIALQPEREGDSDWGPAFRAGLQLSMNRLDPASAPTGNLKRAYAFLEIQTFEADARGIDLGGESYLLGFRLELGRRSYRR